VQHKGRITRKDRFMQRTPINPWPWSLPLGYHQAEVTVGATRHLTCAGQTSVDATGQPQHAGDMRAQLTLALQNVETVLAAAAMGLPNITRIVVYTTDVDAALQNFDLLGQRFGPASAAPPMTLLGVTRLAMPPLMIELEITAAD
jgi:enamine deaminase RidA (YjgF/YER057c/UK114 family)